MADSFGNIGDSQDFPARKIVAVTPHDTNDIDVTKAIYVTVDGTLNFIPVDNSAAVTIPVMVGSVLPIRVKRVLATGTTATVFAMY